MSRDDRIPGFGIDPSYEPKQHPTQPQQPQNSIFGLISKVNSGVMQPPKSILKKDPGLQHAKAVAAKFSHVSAKEQQQKQVFLDAKSTIEKIQHGMWKPANTATPGRPPGGGQLSVEHQSGFKVPSLPGKGKPGQGMNAPLGGPASQRQGIPGSGDVPVAAAPSPKKLVEYDDDDDKMKRQPPSYGNQQQLYQGNRYIGNRGDTDTAEYDGNAARRDRGRFRENEGNAARDRGRFSENDSRGYRSDAGVTQSGGNTNMSSQSQARGNRRFTETPQSRQSETGNRHGYQPQPYQDDLDNRRNMPSGLMQTQGQRGVIDTNRNEGQQGPIGRNEGQRSAINRNEGHQGPIDSNRIQVLQGNLPDNRYTTNNRPPNPNEQMDNRYHNSNPDLQGAGSQSSGSQYSHANQYSNQRQYDNQSADRRYQPDQTHEGNRKYKVGQAHEGDRKYQPGQTQQSNLDNRYTGTQGDTKPHRSQSGVTAVDSTAQQYGMDNRYKNERPHDGGSTTQSGSYRPNQQQSGQSDSRYRERGRDDGRYRNPNDAGQEHEGLSTRYGSDSQSHGGNQLHSGRDTKYKSENLTTNRMESRQWISSQGGSSQEQYGAGVGDSSFRTDIKSQSPGAAGRQSQSLAVTDSHYTAVSPAVFDYGHAPSNKQEHYTPTSVPYKPTSVQGNRQTGQEADSQKGRDMYGDRRNSGDYKEGRELFGDRANFGDTQYHERNDPGNEAYYNKGNTDQAYDYDRDDRSSGSGDRRSGSGDRRSGSGDQRSDIGERMSGSGEGRSGSYERHSTRDERSSQDRRSGSRETDNRRSNKHGGNRSGNYDWTPGGENRSSKRSSQSDMAAGGSSGRNERLSNRDGRIVHKDGRESDRDSGSPGRIPESKNRSTSGRNERSSGRDRSDQSPDRVSRFSDRGVPDRGGRSADAGGRSSDRGGRSTSRRANYDNVTGSGTENNIKQHENDRKQHENDRKQQDSGYRRSRSNERYDDDRNRIGDPKFPNEAADDYNQSSINDPQYGNDGQVQDYMADRDITGDSKRDRDIGHSRRREGSGRRDSRDSWNSRDEDSRRRSPGSDRERDASLSYDDGGMFRAGSQEIDVGLEVDAVRYRDQDVDVRDRDVEDDGYHDDRHSYHSDDDNDGAGCLVDEIERQGGYDDEDFRIVDDIDQLPPPGAVRLPIHGAGLPIHGAGLPIHGMVDPLAELPRTSDGQIMFVVPPPALGPTGPYCQDCNLVCLDMDIYNTHLLSDTHLLNLQKKAQELFNIEARTSRFETDSFGNPLKAAILPPTTMITGINTNSTSTSMAGYTQIGRNIFKGGMSPDMEDRRPRSAKRFRKKTELQMNPPKPLGPLQAITIRATWVLLRWKGRVGLEEKLIDRYVVEYRNARETCWARVGQTLQPEFEVSGLQAGTDYLFRVYAMKRRDKSEMLESVLITTTKKRRDDSPTRRRGNRASRERERNRRSREIRDQRLIGRRTSRLEADRKAGTNRDRGGNKKPSRERDIKPGTSGVKAGARASTAGKLAARARRSVSVRPASRTGASTSIRAARIGRTSATTTTRTSVSDRDNLRATRRSSGDKTKVEDGGDGGTDRRESSGSNMETDRDGKLTHRQKSQEEEEKSAISKAAEDILTSLDQGAKKEGAPGPLNANSRIDASAATAPKTPTDTQTPVASTTTIGSSNIGTIISGTDRQTDDQPTVTVGDVTVNAAGEVIVTEKGAADKLKADTSLEEEEPVECMLYQEFKDHGDSPLLGLDDIYELVSYNTTTFPRYVCKLCNSKGSHKVIMRHIVGFQHKMAFFKKYDEDIYDSINLLTIKKQQLDRLNIEGLKVEDTKGRGAVKVLRMLNPHDNNNKVVYRDPVAVPAPKPVRAKEEVPEVDKVAKMSQFDQLHKSAITSGLEDHTLIGLQYVKEYIHPTLEEDCKYSCTLCTILCGAIDIIFHIVGKKHRLAYLKANHADIFTEVSNGRDLKKLLPQKIKQLHNKEGPGHIKSMVSKNKFKSSAKQESKKLTGLVNMAQRLNIVPGLDGFGLPDQTAGSGEPIQVDQDVPTPAANVNSDQNNSAVQAIKFGIKKNEPTKSSNVKPTNVLELTPVKNKEPFDWNKENGILQAKILNETIIKSSRKAKFITVYSGFFKKFPVIGLQWVTEFQKPDTKQEPWYMCFMCQHKLLWKNILDHVTCNLHRINYMKKSAYREKYTMVYNMIKDKKSDAKPAIEKIAKEIAQEEGPVDHMEVMVELNVNTEAIKSVMKVQENVKAHASSATSSLHLGHVTQTSSVAATATLTSPAVSIDTVTATPYYGHTVSAVTTTPMGSNITVLTSSLPAMPEAQVQAQNQPLPQNPNTYQGTTNYQPQTRAPILSQPQVPVSSGPVPQNQLTQPLPMMGTQTQSGNVAVPAVQQQVGQVYQQAPVQPTQPQQVPVAQPNFSVPPPGFGGPPFNSNSQHSTPQQQQPVVGQMPAPAQQQMATIQSQQVAGGQIPTVPHQAQPVSQQINTIGQQRPEILAPQAQPVNQQTYQVASQVPVPLNQSSYQSQHLPVQGISNTAQTSNQYSMSLVQQQQTDTMQRQSSSLQQQQPGLVQHQRGLQQQMPYPQATNNSNATPVYSAAPPHTVTTLYNSSAGYSVTTAAYSMSAPYSTTSIYSTSATYSATSSQGTATPYTGTGAYSGTATPAYRNTVPAVAPQANTLQTNNNMPLQQRPVAPYPSYPNSVPQITPASNVQQYPPQSVSQYQSTVSQISQTVPPYQQTGIHPQAMTSQPSTHVQYPQGTAAMPTSVQNTVPGNSASYYPTSSTVTQSSWSATSSYPPAQSAAYSSSQPAVPSTSYPAYTVSGTSTASGSVTTLATSSYSSNTVASNARPSNSSTFDYPASNAGPSKKLATESYSSNTRSTVDYQASNAGMSNSSTFDNPASNAGPSRSSTFDYQSQSSVTIDATVQEADNYHSTSHLGSYEGNSDAANDEEEERNSVDVDYDLEDHLEKPVDSPRFNAYAPMPAETEKHVYDPEQPGFERGEKRQFSSSDERDLDTSKRSRNEEEDEVVVEVVLHEKNKSEPQIPHSRNRRREYGGLSRRSRSISPVRGGPVSRSGGNLSGNQSYGSTDRQSRKGGSGEDGRTGRNIGENQGYSSSGVPSRKGGNGEENYRRNTRWSGDRPAEAFQEPDQYSERDDRQEIITDQYSEHGDRQEAIKDQLDDDACSALNQADVDALVRQYNIRAVDDIRGIQGARNNTDGMNSIRGMQGERNDSDSMNIGPGFQPGTVGFQPGTVGSEHEFDKVNIDATIGGDRVNTHVTIDDGSESMCGQISASFDNEAGFGVSTEGPESGYGFGDRDQGQSSEMLVINNDNNADDFRGLNDTSKYGLTGLGVGQAGKRGDDEKTGRFSDRSDERIRSRRPNESRENSRRHSDARGRRSRDRSPNNRRDRSPNRARDRSDGDRHRRGRSDRARDREGGRDGSRSDRRGAREGNRAGSREGNRGSLEDRQKHDRLDHSKRDNDNKRGSRGREDRPSRGSADGNRKDRDRTSNKESRDSRSGRTDRGGRSFTSSRDRSGVDPGLPSRKELDMIRALRALEADDKPSFADRERVDYRHHSDGLAGQSDGLAGRFGSDASGATGVVDEPAIPRGFVHSVGDSRMYQGLQSTGRDTVIPTAIEDIGSLARPGDGFPGAPQPANIPFGINTPSFIPGHPMAPGPAQNLPYSMNNSGVGPNFTAGLQSNIGPGHMGHIGAHGQLQFHPGQIGGQGQLGGQGSLVQGQIGVQGQLGGHGSIGQGQMGFAQPNQATSNFNYPGMALPGPSMGQAPGMAPPGVQTFPQGSGFQDRRTDELSGRGRMPAHRY